MRNCHNGGECRFTWQDSAVFRGVSDGRILPGCLGSGMSLGSSKDRGLSVALALRMPRPCAVEVHVRSYKEKPTNLSGDATALRRGASRSPLQNKPKTSWRCHGLAPWSLMLAATNAHSLSKTAPPLDVLTNLRASQITVAADIETRLPETFNPRRNQRSANLFLRRVHQLNSDIAR